MVDPEPAPSAPTGPAPFVFDDTGETKRFAPATLHNRDAITHVLGAVLPASGTILEIASGTGEHLVHFAREFPHLNWQPSDYDDAGLASIAAWSAEAALPNILAPVRIDAASPDWPVAQPDAILCINMVHISPWAATLGLMAGAGRLLPRGGMLYLYGPFRQAGIPLAEGNASFDASLRDRNPDWGLRRVEDVAAVALGVGLDLEAVHEMPANNVSLVFRRG